MSGFLGPKENLLACRVELKIELALFPVLL